MSGDRDSYGKEKIDGRDLEEQTMGVLREGTQT